MKRCSLHAATASFALLALFGCSKAAPDLPPPPSPEPALPQPASASAGNTSVPAAASVFTPGSASSADASGGRSNKAMSRAQESTAMPMPGQNNDHSAPVGPARPASGR